VVNTSSPGANRSTDVAPQADEELMRSAALELPTVTRLVSVRLAGYIGAVSRSRASFPAAATTSTPWAPAYATADRRLSRAQPLAPPPQEALMTSAPWSTA
jgi:hypothetical protein